MTTAEKVAYLKGLAEGYGTDPATKEGKILTTILDILEDLALDLDDLGADVAELGEGLDAVSDDLEDVEQLLFDDEEDTDQAEEDGEDADGEKSPGEAPAAAEEGEPWDGQSVFYECQCPNCGETITFEESVLHNGSIQCPNCGESLEFDVDGADGAAETPQA